MTPTRSWDMSWDATLGHRSSYFASRHLPSPMYCGIMLVGKAAFLDTYAGLFLCTFDANCESWISGKLNFCEFGTEFLDFWNWVSENLRFFRHFFMILGKNFLKNLVFERFGTEFLAKNWVFGNFWELSFCKSGTEFFGFAQKKSLKFWMIKIDLKI